MALTDPMTGTISTSPTMRGVHAGGGVNRGGQQGRPRALTGGLPGAKSPIPNAKGSQPAPAPGVGQGPKPNVPGPTPAPAPTTKPQDAPRPATGGRPVYSWWRANALAPWERYISSWQEGV